MNNNIEPISKQEQNEEICRTNGFSSCEEERLFELAFAEEEERLLQMSIIEEEEQSLNRAIAQEEIIRNNALSEEERLLRELAFAEQEESLKRIDSANREVICHTPFLRNNYNVPQGYVENPTMKWSSTSMGKNFSWGGNES